MTTNPPPDAPPWAVGFCYLLESDAGFQKIGFSAEPQRRVNEVTRLPFAVWLGHQFPVGTKNVETRLHGFFVTRKARGEWYSLGADGINLVKSIPAARSTASLPEPFQRSARYLGTYTPAAVIGCWGEVASAFATRLLVMRTDRHLTREQLAERSGLPPWVIRRYEAGQATNISWHEVLALAVGLGVPTDAFRGN